MNTPSISILLPFTREKSWLKEAIHSIINQSFTDWELLLINNSSDHETSAIAENFCQTSDKIKLIFENRPGISFALNTGLSNAKGPFIARMDADDSCHRDRLKLQLEYLKRHPEIDVISCQTTPHPDGIIGEGFHHYMKWQNALISPDDHFTNRFIESPLAHPTVMFSKALPAKFGGYTEEDVPEDYELWLRWMSEKVRFQKIPEYLYQWRDHPNRLSRSSKNYSAEKFHLLKSAYLSQELRKHHSEKSIIICGANRENRRKSEILESFGIKISGFTDVVERTIEGKIFIPADEITPDAQLFYVSFVSSRGKSTEMWNFLTSKKLEEGKSFLLAG